MDDGSGGADGSTDRSRRSRLPWWIAGGVAVVVVLAVGGPFVYIHLIEGPPPTALSLPASPPTSSGAGSSSGTASGASGISGTWSVGPGSVVGYRVDEVLIGQHTTAVGRSSTVSGSVTVTGTTVTGGTVTVDMSSVVSDQSQRNAQFDGRIMDVAAYPTATLRLTSPIGLGSAPVAGQVDHTTGTLTMHGATHPVTFPVQLERSADNVSVLADVPIAFATWGIANPSIAGFVTTASTGKLEALLVLTTGTGNPAVGTGGSGAASTPAGGGPVTVPSTTVPPLGVPTARRAQRRLSGRGVTGPDVRTPSPATQ
jgi:polyisoprenoid-binding protein YceI